MRRKKVIFGERLDEYKYYDMDWVIAAALGDEKELCRREESHGSKLLNGF